MECLKNYCQKKFEKIESLKTHLKDVHNMKEFDLYKCSFLGCDKTFNKSSSFYRHLQTGHNFDKGKLSIIISF